MERKLEKLRFGQSAEEVTDWQMPDLKTDQVEGKNPQAPTAVPVEWENPYLKK